MKAKCRMTMIAFAIAIMSIFSCSDDDRDNTPSNSFTKGDTTIAIKSALFIYDPTASELDGLYSHELSFISEGFTVEDNYVQGTGSLVSFYFYLNSATIEPGTYTYTGEEILESYNMWGSVLAIDRTIVLYEGQVYRDGGEVYSFSDGVLKVSKSGDEYTFEFEGTVYLKDDPSVESSFEGYFKGSVSAYEEN